MTDKLIEALEEAERVLAGPGTYAETRALTIVRQALSAHRSQQESASTEAKGVEPFGHIHEDLDGVRSLRTKTARDLYSVPIGTKLYTSPAPSESEAKDAARYRWLLANYAIGDGWINIDDALNDGSADENLSPAIDAAMRDAALSASGKVES